MKKTLFIISIIVTIIVAIFMGIFIFQNVNKQGSDIYEAKTIEDECTIEGETMGIGVLDSVQTNSEEEKVGPNTNLKLKKIYTDCKHIINETVELPPEIINMNKDELESEYKDWKLEEFSQEEIVLSREYSGICNEHYIVRIVGEVLGIYTLDEESKAVLKEKTEIYVNYLPQNDILRLKEGIEVIGKENLNSLLEDYE